MMVLLSSREDANGKCWRAQRHDARAKSQYRYIQRRATNIAGNPCRRINSERIRLKDEVAVALQQTLAKLYALEILLTRNEEKSGELSNIAATDATTAEDLSKRTEALFEGTGREDTKTALKAMQSMRTKTTEAKDLITPLEETFGSATTQVQLAQDSLQVIIDSLGGVSEELEKASTQAGAGSVTYREAMDYAADSATLLETIERSH